jgi:hypothetical protein
MRRIMLLAFVAAVVSGGCGIAGDRPVGYEKRDYVVDPGLRFRPTPLHEIVRNPQMGAQVEFEAMLNRRDESVWQAYYTPFRPGDYKSFSVWPADAAVWDPRGRGRSIATLYLAAGSPEIADLYEIEQYSPIRIRGVVKSNFDSRPWIEVHYVDVMDSPWFTEESLGHLIRGLDGARANTKHAESLLEDALDGPLSPSAEAAAWKALGWMSLVRKKHSDAEKYYARALDAAPGDRQAADGLMRARRKAGAGDWTDEPTSKDDPAPTANWKAMYTELMTEHETNCKALAETHARCAEMAQAMTAERDAAVKAHADCASGAEGVKKQLEEKDAAIKEAGEKTAALEAERDQLKKNAEAGGADMEGARKQIEEKDAALRTANEKVAALEAERDELKKKADAGGADMEGVRKQIEEKDAALKTANEKVAALEAERDELKKRAEAGGDPEGVKKQLEAATSKIAELEQQVKDRDESIRKQREEIDRLTEELKKKEGGD